MSLTEFFQKIVVPDTKSPINVNETDKPAFVSDKASLKDLVSKMVNGGTAPQTETPTVSIPAPVQTQPVAQAEPQVVATPVNAPVEISIPENLNIQNETPAAPVQEKLIEENLPMVIEASEKTVEERAVAQAEKIEAVVKNINESNIEVLENSIVPEKKASENNPAHVEGTEYLYGRELIKATLSEFNELLIVGKELDDKMKERENKGKLNEEQEKARAKANEARTMVAQSLANLLASDEDPDLNNFLGKAVDSYQEYLTATHKMAEELSAKGSKESNALLILINAKRNQIKILTEKLGGTKIIEEMKKHIRACESVARKDIEGRISRGEVKEKIVEEVIAKVQESIKNDSEGMKLLVQGGNILDLIIHIYGPQK